MKSDSLSAAWARLQRAETEALALFNDDPRDRRVHAQLARIWRAQADVRAARQRRDVIAPAWKRRR